MAWTYTGLSLIVSLLCLQHQGVAAGRPAVTQDAVKDAAVTQDAVPKKVDVDLFVMSKCP